MTTAPLLTLSGLWQEFRAKIPGWSPARAENARLLYFAGAQGVLFALQRAGVIDPKNPVVLALHREAFETMREAVSLGSDPSAFS